MTILLIILLAVVGRAYFLEKGAPPSSDLSRVSRSSSVVAGCQRKARERLGNVHGGIDGDAKNERMRE